MEQEEGEPVFVEVGFEVYINKEGRPRIGPRAIYIVDSVDALGNIKMHSTNNPSFRRNYPNINVLAGWLYRRDGREIKGRPLQREPLEYRPSVYIPPKPRPRPQRGIAR